METNDNNGVVMETKDAGVDEVKVDIEECDDANRLSTI